MGRRILDETLLLTRSHPQAAIPRLGHVMKQRIQLHMTNRLSGRDSVGKVDTLFIDKPYPANNLG